MNSMSVRPVIHAFRRGWKTLLAVHLAVTLLAATIVAPSAAGLIQLAVSVSGEPALSDTAIAVFVFSPAGAAAVTLIAALVLTLQLLGYAALLIPARQLLRTGTCNIGAVVRLLPPALPSILRVSLRFVVWTVLWVLPFAGLIALIHIRLLGGHDINYYLAEKPPVFFRALALAALVMLACIVVLARLATGWVHALPLVMFQRESPGEALRVSRQAAAGKRGVIFGGLVAWGMLTPLAASLVNLPWSAIAMGAADRLQDQLGWLVIVLGLCFALAIATGFLAGFCGLSLLALQNLRIYQQSGLDTGPDLAVPEEPAPAIRIKTAVAGLLVLFAATVFLSDRWIERLHDEHPAVVIAHRGASAEAPENTMAAVRTAVEAGADWVEVDVQESADGSVMVFHDSDFKRMGGPAQGIWELRDPEIARIDIGSWKSPEFAAERTPFLTDVLAACKGRCGVIIELKYYGHDQRLEERVVDLVEAAGMADQVMIMSLNRQGIRKIRQLRPEWKIGLLSTVALGNVTKLDVDFLGLNARTTSRRLVREAAKRGIKIHVWTVNRPVDMANMLARGVDGLITDDPRLARQVLQERDDATFGEKLLMELAAVLGKPPPSSRQ
jgi:glycerophosphoryl diester phosphodiesterase